MQPSSTLYSGVHQGDILLKFCCEDCKQFWFPTAADLESLHVASFLDDIYQPKQTLAPILTIIIKKENGVEQIYLSVGAVSEGVEDLNIPYIVWHIRELEHQRFAHFYISKECLPLKPVWIKQYCTSESEAISNIIANERSEVQSHFQICLNQAIKTYDFENLEAFLMQAKNDVALQSGEYKICNACMLCHYIDF